MVRPICHIKVLRCFTRTVFLRPVSIFAIAMASVIRILPPPAATPTALSVAASLRAATLPLGKAGSPWKPENSSWGIGMKLLKLLQHLYPLYWHLTVLSWCTENYMKMSGVLIVIWMRSAQNIRVVKKCWRPNLLGAGVPVELRLRSFPPRPRPTPLMKSSMLPRPEYMPSSPILRNRRWRNTPL